MKRALISLLAAALISPMAIAQVPGATASNSTYVGVQGNVQYGEGNRASNLVYTEQSAEAFAGGRHASPMVRSINPEYGIGPGHGGYSLPGGQAFAGNDTFVGMQLNLQEGEGNEASNSVETYQSANARAGKRGVAAASNSTGVETQLNLQAGRFNSAHNSVVSGQDSEAKTGRKPLFLMPR